MTLIRPYLAVMFALVLPATAFEVDGFRWGMSYNEAKTVISARTFKEVEYGENSIGLIGTVPGERHFLSFFQGKLRMLRKYHAPTFAGYVAVAKKLRNELGKPFDVYAERVSPVDLITRDSITIFWKSDTGSVSLAYHEDQLSVMYTASYWDGLERKKAEQDENANGGNAPK